MKTKSKTLKSKLTILKVNYIIVGALLLLAWPYLVAAIPQQFMEMQGLRVVLTMLPVAAGAILLPVGFVYFAKMERLYKFLIVAPIAALLCFAGFYAAILVILGSRGLY